MLARLHEERGSLADAMTAVLAVAVVLGSAALWIGIPFGGLWLAGELTSTAQGFLFATLGGIPLAMTASAWLLYRVNDLYERSRGTDDGGGRRRSAWLVSSSDERHAPPSRPGASRAHRRGDDGLRVDGPRLNGDLVLLLQPDVARQPDVEPT